jgi:hypothetical protein
MIKKNLPLIISFFFLFLIIYFWNYIKLPYDINNKILGEYFYKKYNPINDTIRFLIFIGIPVFVYLYFYLKVNSKDKLSIKKNNKDFFLKKLKKSEADPLKKYSFFLIFLIVIEFLSFDFNYYIASMDIFHAGTFLVPPMNFLLSNKLLQSTIHDYGFIANNLGLIYKYFFGYYTYGSIIFIFYYVFFL